MHLFLLVSYWSLISRGLCTDRDRKQEQSLLIEVPESTWLTGPPPYTCTQKLVIDKLYKITAIIAFI
jgi:hypothetical protein